MTVTQRATSPSWSDVMYRLRANTQDKLQPIKWQGQTIHTPYESQNAILRLLQSADKNIDARKSPRNRTVKVTDNIDYRHQRSMNSVTSSLSVLGIQ